MHMPPRFLSAGRDQFPPLASAGLAGLVGWPGWWVRWVVWVVR